MTVTAAYESDQIPARVHGRIYRREARETPSSLLLVGFHGYGEGAETLLEELDRIPSADGWTLGCVQGLHRFYNRRSGEVVASWMTRQDRLTAIEDNLAYVESGVRHLARGLPSRTPIVYVGFSQGTAMAYRAAARVPVPCSGVIALAGDVPPELGEQDLGAFPPVLIGWGSRDKWYGEVKLAQDIEILSERGVRCESFGFSGGHEWTDEFRSVASRWIQTTASSRLEAPEGP